MHKIFRLSTRDGPRQRNGESLNRQYLGTHPVLQQQHQHRNIHWRCIKTSCGLESWLYIRIARIDRYRKNIDRFQLRGTPWTISFPCGLQGEAMWNEPKSSGLIQSDRLFFLFFNSFTPATAAAAGISLWNWSGITICVSRQWKLRGTRLDVNFFQ